MPNCFNCNGHECRMVCMNGDGCRRLLRLGMGYANGLLMSGSIGDVPYERTSPNRRWVPKLLGRFTTLSTEWVKSPFEALAHGGRGAAIDGWWCQDPCREEVSFSLSDVGAGGWVARSILSRVRGFNNKDMCYCRNRDICYCENKDMCYCRNRDKISKRKLINWHCL